MLRTTMLLACCALLVGVVPPAAPEVVRAAVVPGSGGGAVRPVRPVPGAVVQPFRPPATRYGAGHRGVDMAALPGTAVRSVLPGTVRFSGPVAGAGWVTVDHGGGLDTTYGDLEPRLVAAGRRVTAGAVLGRVAEGRGHLDWGARLDGVYIDPMGLLGRWEIHLAG